ncbi:MAG TPA: isoprenylcysteine carboxylmethyltransferase family protein [Solirubrobacteraceae bacterium]|nr:isoprenylcysteine carboxylmethyltransferase family protein [Solirubrobacteraceae bacterium]
MPGLALVLCLAYLTLVFGVRSLVLYARTGRTGWVDPGAKGSTERLADLLCVAALALVLGSPILALSGLIEPIAALDGAPAHTLGVAVFALSALLAGAAQRTMGSAWRTGIDPGDPGELVVDGPFSLVRNPVYTTIIATALGAGLLAPTVVGLVAVLASVLALELQTRGVEEPHLLRVHGERYAHYAARVGRFVPGIGRLRSS